MINLGGFIDTLPIMFFGMLGIFIVIATVFICIKILNKVTKS